jgi:hypothetical protein
MIGFNTCIGKELLCYTAATNYSKSLRFITIGIYFSHTYNDIIWELYSSLPFKDLSFWGIHDPITRERNESYSVLSFDASANM